MLLSDAGFAGDLKDGRSTSGSLLFLGGSLTLRPIAWLCKTQRAKSHSAAEPEIAAMHMGLRLEGMPTVDLWDVVVNVLEPLDKEVYSRVKEDARAKATHLLPFESQESLASDNVPPNLRKERRS